MKKFKEHQVEVCKVQEESSAKQKLERNKQNSGNKETPEAFEELPEFIFYGSGTSLSLKIREFSESSLNPQRADPKVVVGNTMDLW